MLPSILRLVVGSACAAVLWIGSANATTFTPITPGGSYVLTGDTLFYYNPNPGTLVGLGSTDDFTFTYTPTLTAINSTSTISIGSSSFTTFTLDWSLGGSTLIGGPLNLLGAPYFGAVTNLPLPLAGAGTYLLEIIWARSNATDASHYDTQIQTSPEVPLPPAIVLFASALAGMGLLARRRRKSGQQLMVQT